VSHTFGGLRTCALHGLRFQAVDTAGDAFAFGCGSRRKTERPRKPQIPATLRRVQRDWWTRHGEPIEDLVFPALRGDKAGVGDKHGVSHANALRRDL
jgi:hypothetical protein